MPFQQPALTKIRKADFQKNAFSFPVESIVKGQQSLGKLHIEASAGYLLTTSANTKPEPEQTIRYVLQPDGSRVASTIVTLLGSGSTLEAGTVTLSDPLGERSVLTIDVSTDISLLPVLTVSNPDLSFGKTDPGDESFAILKISQQYADTPLTISVDDPAHFSIAMGHRQLTFVPSLTLTPSVSGTYIHIRYAPDRPGRHAAKLFVEAPYDMKMVMLRGRASGLLLPQRQEKRLVPDNVSVPDNQRPAQPRRLGLPAMLVLGGLAFTGYTYRCELAPSLCQARSDAAPVAAPLPERPADTSSAQITAGQDRANTPAKTGPRRTEAPVTQLQADRPGVAQPGVAQSELTPSLSKKSKRRLRSQTDSEVTRSETDSPDEPSEVGEGESVEQPIPNRQAGSKRRGRVAGAVKTVESELERELNKENLEPNQ